MSDSVTCQRCNLPIIGTRYSFRVDTDPPIASVDVVDVSICPACLESMQRWMERRQRNANSLTPESDEIKASSATRTKSGKSRKKSRKGRSRHDDPLKRAEGWLRLRAGMVISLVVTAFAVLFVLVAVEIAVFTRRKASGTETTETSVLSAPVLPPVDLDDPDELQ